MNKRIVGALLLFLLASVFVVVIWLLLPVLSERQQTTTSDAAKTRDKIRIGVDNWIGYFPLCSPEMKGAMRQEGYLLVCEDDHADYQGRMQQLKEGKLELAVATVDSFLLNGAPLGFPATIATVIDESKGGDAILSRLPEVTSLDALKGRSDIRVAFTPASPSHYLLKAAADHFNVPELHPPKGARRIETDGSEAAREKLLTGGADLAVLWEPDVSKALEQAGISKILGTEDTERLIVDILLVNREFSQKSPQTVQLLLATYFKVLKKYREDQGLLRKHVEKETGLGEDKIELMLGGVHWASFMENCEKWFGISMPGAYAEEGLLETIEATAVVLTEAGDFTSSPIPDNNPYRLTNSTFLETLFKSGVSGFTLPGHSNGSMSGTGDSLQTAFVPLDEQGWAALKEIGTLRVNPIIFQRGSAQLSLLAKQVVDDSVAKIKHYPRFRIIVRGHTGTKGDRDENRKLSRLRAEAVARYMQITYGMDPNRLRTEGLGGEMPLPKSDGESERAYQYRLPRVELLLVREEI